MLKRQNIAIKCRDAQANQSRPKRHHLYSKTCLWAENPALPHNIVIDRAKTRIWLNDTLNEYLTNTFKTYLTCYLLTIKGIQVTFLVGYICSLSMVSSLCCPQATLLRITHSNLQAQLWHTMNFLYALFHLHMYKAEIHSHFVLQNLIRKVLSLQKLKTFLKF